MGYTRKSRLSWRRVGKQTVVVDPEGKRLFGLNASAGAIWHALDGARSSDVLVELFEGEDGGGERRRAVEAFLEGLERDGLVERGPGPTPVGERPAEVRSPWAPPEVAWREQIQTFARACAFHPGQNEICIPSPRS